MKEIIILGDIELGAGTLTDDFISDITLSKTIDSLTKKKHPVDLIFNGDTLDFLKCPTIINGKKKYPRHITEKTSLIKLNLIYQAHGSVFEAIRKFVQKKENSVYFIIGNHDYDLQYRAVRRSLRTKLEARGNVYFGFKYQKHGVYAEHGQQYDILHRINPRNGILRFKGKFLLNMPWVSLGAISFGMPLKEEHPFLERIVPRPILMKNHEVMKKKFGYASLWYLFKSLVYYPFRYYNDPTYKIPRALFGEFYHRINKVHYDLDSVVDSFKRRRKDKLRKHRIFVFGHIHKNYVEEKDNWVIIHPDTWRDEYVMDKETKILTPKSKKYVSIKYDASSNNRLEWEIIEVPVKRTNFHFEDVCKDEIGSLLKAAAEENFQPKFTTLLK